MYVMYIICMYTFRMFLHLRNINVYIYIYIHIYIYIDIPYVSRERWSYSLEKPTKSFRTPSLK